jgi:hypothetical protein
VQLDIWTPSTANPLQAHGDLFYISAIGSVLLNELNNFQGEVGWFVAQNPLPGGGCSAFPNKYVIFTDDRQSFKCHFQITNLGQWKSYRSEIADVGYGPEILSWYHTGSAWQILDFHSSGGKLQWWGTDVGWEGVVQPNMGANYLSTQYGNILVREEYPGGWVSNSARLSSYIVNNNAPKPHTYNGQPHNATAYSDAGLYISNHTNGWMRGWTVE